MNLQNLGARFLAKVFLCLTAFLSGIALLPLGQTALLAQAEPTPPTTQPVAQESATPAPDAPKIPNDQLDSLVAPIALYPDPLLAQTLASSTYPLEIILLEQWLEKNKNLKGKALSDAVAKQKWDPSVQSMAGIPDALKRMAGNIGWTTDLGNAFLAQPQDVMDAVQRMRAKAQSKGALKTSQQQTVETQKVEGNKEVIVIQQPNPEVVYVPSYDPAVVYGPPAYPYYPYYYPGYVPGMGLALGTGIILGAAWANNNWGNCNWNNGGNININNNNNFNRNNVNNINRNQPGGGKWQHQPSHRGGAPYSNRTTAQKYGSTSHRDASNRQTNRPSQQPARTDRQNPRSTDRSSGADRQKPATSDRSRANTPSNRTSSGGDRVANRQVSQNPSPRTNNAFSGPSSGMNRSSSFASHDRGSRSMSSSRGGGMSRSSGGSRGGGRRR